MKYQKIKTFSSKRNDVILAQPCLEDRPLVVVKKFDENVSGFLTEQKVVTLLQNKNIRTPKIINAKNQTLVYEYIDGDIVLDFIENLENTNNWDPIYRIFDSLCLWLANCYQALEESYQKEMILRDIHLRNFIFKDEIYGVDFECVTEGSVEEDIARLAIFTATYSPACTPAKYALAGFLCEKSLEYIKLDYDLLLQEMEHQLDMISKRRNTIYETGVVENIIDNMKIGACPLLHF